MTVIGGAASGGEGWRRLASARRALFDEKDRQTDTRCRGGDGCKGFDEEGRKAVGRGT